VLAAAAAAAESVISASFLAALDAPRLSGVYLLLVDMFCCDCFSDIGGGQLGRESVRPATIIHRRR